MRKDGLRFGRLREKRALSEKSGVNLRTLQQYEIRAKDINKAAGETLLALATVIGCSITDLMEI